MPMLTRIYDDPLRMLADAKLAFLEAQAGGATAVELLVRLDPPTRRIGACLTGLVSPDACLEYEFLVGFAAFTGGAWQQVPEALRPLFQGPTHQDRVRALHLLASTPLLIAFSNPTPDVLTYQAVHVR